MHNVYLSTKVPGKLLHNLPSAPSDSKAMLPLPRTYNPSIPKTVAIRLYTAVMWGPDGHWWTKQTPTPRSPYSATP